MAALAGVDMAEIAITSAITLTDKPAPADAFTMDSIKGVAVVFAKATGQNTDLVPALAAQLLEGAKVAISPAFRSEEGAVFGFEQVAPAGACNADQLAAFLGRKV